MTASAATVTARISGSVVTVREKLIKSNGFIRLTLKTDLKLISYISLFCRGSVSVPRINATHARVGMCVCMYNTTREIDN